MSKINKQSRVDESMEKITQQPSSESISTYIWQECPEDNNPFVAHSCKCSGYDVYADILPNASWTEYLYLMFKLERPQHWQSMLLEKISVAIANPGIRDLSVRAAMSASVGGSNAAASLMAALSVGAGKLGGSRDVYEMLKQWQQNGQDLQQWTQCIKNFTCSSTRPSVWQQDEHFPGFDPNGTSCSLPVIQVLQVLTQYSEGDTLKWLNENRKHLEMTVGHPLAMSGVIAAAFHDLEMSSEQAEIIYLLMRLPGAAAHALEQKQFGWRKYPFFADAVEVMNDPQNKCSNDTEGS